MLNKKQFLILAISAFTTNFASTETSPTSQENFLSKNKTILISAAACAATGTAGAIATYFIKNNADQKKLSDLKRDIIFTNSDIEYVAKKYHECVIEFAKICQNKKNLEDLTDEEISKGMNLFKAASLDEKTKKMHALDLLAEQKFTNIIQSSPEYLDTVTKITAFLNNKTQEKAKEEEFLYLQNLKKDTKDKENEIYESYYKLEELLKKRTLKKTTASSTEATNKK
jgi:hypothetical protein